MTALTANIRTGRDFVGSTVMGLASAFHRRRY